MLSCSTSIRSDLSAAPVVDILSKQPTFLAIVDLGCGSGKLLKRLLAERQFSEILGVDVGIQDLEMAARRLRLETLSER